GLLVDVEQDFPIVDAADVYHGQLAQAERAGELVAVVLVELQRPAVGVVPLLHGLLGALRLQADERVDVAGAGRLGVELPEQGPVDAAHGAAKRQVQRRGRQAILKGFDLKPARFRRLGGRTAGERLEKFEPRLAMRFRHASFPPNQYDCDFRLSSAGKLPRGRSRPTRSGAIPGSRWGAVAGTHLAAPTGEP